MTDQTSSERNGVMRTPLGAYEFSGRRLGHPDDAVRDPLRLVLRRNMDYMNAQVFPLTSTL
jgi:hypothetical protein